MARQQVYREIEEMFGEVPGFFKALPDKTLAAEWELFKCSQLDEGPIPPKYRELIGLGIAAVTKCRYCTFFHAEMAKLNGATPAELEDAAHFAKSNAGWSTYLHGLQYDYDAFKREITRACEHVRSRR